MTTANGTTLQCSLDAAPFAACTSPKSYSALGQGSHAFRVKAIRGSALECDHHLRVDGRLGSTAGSRVSRHGRRTRPGPQARPSHSPTPSPA